MDAVTSAPTPSGAEPPWLAITLAAIALIGTVGVAYVPVVQEKVRARSAAQADPTPPAPAAPPPPQSPPPPPASDSLALIREVLADALEQRDAANARARAADERAQQVEDELTEARIHIARLEARGRYGYGP